jgi:hypothetical protein
MRDIKMIKMTNDIVGYIRLLNLEIKNQNQKEYDLNEDGIDDDNIWMDLEELRMLIKNLI